MDADIDMDCEALESTCAVVTTSPSSQQPQLTAETAVAAAGANRGDDRARHPIDDSLPITLIDVIPCNLRTQSKFLESRIEITISRRTMRLLLRCYGFLMYDKFEKLEILRRNTDPAVLEVADILDECKTLADFKVTVQEHLEHIKAILADPGATAALVDEDETNPHAQAEQRNTSAHILNLARQSLEYVFSFIRDSDHLRRSLNVNEYCRRHLLRDNDPLRDNSTRAVYDAWHNAHNCDLNQCLSIVFRDIVVTTGLQTQSTLLFVVRTALMLTYLITNFMYRRDDDSVSTTAVISPPKIYVVIPSQQMVVGHDDGMAHCATANAAATVQDYWQTCDAMTIEKFIATTVISMTRMYLAECVNWPNRVHGAAGPTRSRVETHSSDVLGCSTICNISKCGCNIPLDRIQTLVTKRLLHMTEHQHNSSRPKWLRVMRSGGGRTHRTNPQTNSAANNANSVYGTDARRLYVNTNVLLTMFDELSLSIKMNTNNTNDNGDSGGNGGNAATSSCSYLETQPSPLTIATNQQLQSKCQQYERESRICIDTIVDCLNENDDNGKCASRCSFADFVTLNGSSFRDHDEDLASVVRSFSGKGGHDKDGNAGTIAGSVKRAAGARGQTECERNNDKLDEIDLLGTDVGAVLLFTVLSLIRYDVEPKRYDSLQTMAEAAEEDVPPQWSSMPEKFFNDDVYESHRILLVQAMSHLYQAKMTRSQIQEFFNYLLKMWHLNVGIVSLEQLSEILLMIYRMFPGAYTQSS